MTTDAEQTFEPRIVAFLCNWCSYRAADLAGMSRRRYPANVRLMRVMCSGRVSPEFALRAFELGGDGVAIAGCHPGECHYLEQNQKAMRRCAMLRHTLGGLGVDPERIALVWASAAEGERLARELTAFTERLRALGPLAWREQWTEPEDRTAPVETLAAEHAEALEVPA